MIQGIIRGRYPAGGAGQYKNEIIMDKEINNSTFQYPLTIEELIDDMEKHPDRYKHLQFILNRKKNHNLGLGQKYLVVNSIGFGLYELNGVDYSNGIITMILNP